MLAKVGLMYHVRRHQLRVQSRARKALTARLRVGLRPVQQCRMMVKERAAMEKREAAVSYRSRTRC